ncbi:MAG: phospholipase D-like domain-containing protein [Candidatus Chromulinivorax sp.]
MKKYFLFCIALLQVIYGLGFATAYFTPKDDLTALALDYIKAEKKSIDVAMYMFTDKKIAQALVDAKNRGVLVQVIVDQISMTSCGKGRFLQEHGVIVFVHRTMDFNPYTMALMHHKFFIFGCNKDDQSLLWTGSWNCTVRATQYNDENVLVLDDQGLILQYQNYFKSLKERLS